jgi:hypothetical protein
LASLLDTAEVPWGPVAAVLGRGRAVLLLASSTPSGAASRLSIIDALRRA